jgi:hypothetical protein
MMWSLANCCWNGCIFPTDSTCRKRNMLQAGPRESTHVAMDRMPLSHSSCVCSCSDKQPQLATAATKNCSNQQFLTAGNSSSKQYLTAGQSPRSPGKCNPHDN